MKQLTNLDLTLNQLLNAVAQNLAGTSDIPSAGLIEGRIIYDSISHSIKFYNGTSWVDPAAEMTSTLGVANGGTGATSLTSGEVLVGNGTGAVSTLGFDDQVTEDSTNLVKSGVIYDFVTSALNSALGTFESMTFKGTVAADGTITSTDTDLNDTNIASVTGYKNGYVFKAAADIPTSVVNIGGKKIEAGDMIVVIGDYNSAWAATDFAVIQGNLDGTVVGPASATNDQIAIFDGTTGKLLGGAVDGSGNAVTMSSILTKLGALFTVGSGSDITVTPASGEDLAAGGEFTFTLNASGATAGTYGANDSLVTATKVAPGDTINTTKTTVDAKGRVTSIETQSFTLDTPKIARIQNPALTPVSGTATWTVTHNLDVTYPVVTMYEISTGEQVMADITYTSANTLTVEIVAASTVTAGTYVISIVG